MATFRFDNFADDTVVLHFGGDAERIDAYTLADALIGFADMARAINSTIDPGTEIELLVEATGPGSFRARIRRIKKDYGGLLAVSGAVFWGVVGNYIYDEFVKDEKPPQITVNADGTIVKVGKHTIVVNHVIQNATDNAKKNPAVQSGLAKTFSALEADENVKEFGVTGSLKDADPLISIPRADFPKLAKLSLPAEPQSRERTQTKRARLFVLKAWLNHAKRKWSFEWNGEPISAPITDAKFWIALTAEKYYSAREMRSMLK